MSIQINGIDKPKSCFDCPCIDAEFEECAAREHYLLPKDEYGAVLGDVPDWCPITELPTCEDAVSRQQAIDAIWDASPEDRAGMEENIKALPSAQPEIIACGDCKHWICHDRRCGYWNHGVKPLDFCSRAERREE